MVFRARRVRPALLLIAVLVPILGACSTAMAGSAQIAGARLSATSASDSSVDPPVSSSVDPPVDRTTDIASSDWTSADVAVGPDGIPSPTGDLTAQLTGNLVCFRPVRDTGAGSAPCAELAGADRPTYAVYSPDGTKLLVVAGPEGSADRSIYVIDTDDASIRVIGPDGVTDRPAGEPPRWSLESIAWSADGSVVIVPHADTDTGLLLSANLADGSISESISLSAQLANGEPSIWPTRNGTALVINNGPERRHLWWQFGDTSGMTHVAFFPEEGGSLHLAAADPLGRFVLVCPRSAAGRLGATVAVTVLARTSMKVLTDSMSCAGSVVSADGRYVALTAQLARGYSLVVMEVATNRRVLTVPLPEAEPAQPPYLTWLGDVVVAADVSGEWSAPSLIMRLR